jgi:HK97 family phage major capsid protein
MSKLAELKARREEVVGRLQHLATKAAEDNDMSDAELDESKALRDERSTLEAELVAEERGYAERQERMNKLLDFTPQVKPLAPAGRKSLGQTFVDSREYKSLLARGGGSVPSGSWTSGTVEFKDDEPLTTLGTGGDFAGGVLIPEQVQSGIIMPLEQPNNVIDLMPQGVATSNTIRVLREDTAGTTNDAAAVTEGDAKPSSALQFTEVDEPVRKIATFLPVSDEMLEDAGQLRSYIDTRLAMFVRTVENRQVLEGDGDAPNLAGILDRSIGTTTAGAGASGVLAAKMSIAAASFLTPDAMVIHPDDWAVLLSETDLVDRHYGGGPFDQLGHATYWGMKVVVTAEKAAGSALIGNFALGAQVWRRGGVTVEASNSHSDFFIKNKTAIRAESRLALAVYRLTAFANHDLIP